MTEWFKWNGNFIGFLERLVIVIIFTNFLGRLHENSRLRVGSGGGAGSASAFKSIHLYGTDHKGSGGGAESARRGRGQE